MNNKELYMMLGSLKILLETNNHDKAIELIKDTMSLIDGTKKISNITDNSSVMKLWTELNHFCVSKRSSHFAILETTQNMQLLNNKYFSELIYHRLLVSAK